MQILPSADLTRYIRHYLLINRYSDQAERLRLFSDGSTGLFFSSEGPGLLHIGNQRRGNGLSDAFFYGQLSCYQDILFQGNSSWFIIVLRPDAISRLLAVPAIELRDQVIDLPDLFGPSSRELHERLGESRTTADKIDAVETFFRKLISRYAVNDDPMVSAAVAFLIQHSGAVSIEQLARFTGYEQRQLERRFNHSVGLSPKVLGSIIRLHIFLKQLRLNPFANLTALGYESGFYDQSHLIREFKKITGLTPSQYKTQASPLAVNFLRIENEG
jgi:AraC-like DNA-binding protein